MKLTANIFVEGIQLDQFNDSSIQINLGVQNIADLQKVFSDFTQSFTIPASPVNNRVFQHFYESDITYRKGVVLDYNLRRTAYIEIDTYTFRTGKVMLEKSNVKDGLPYSYQITFYTELTTFKDILGENKLSDLDYSLIDAPFSYQDVKDRIEIPDSITNYDIRYPLISSKRVWNMFDPLNPAEDIYEPATGIVYNELFPALRVTKIMELIQADYGITFTGTFLTNPLIKEVWIWYKNKTANTESSATIDFDFISASNQYPPFTIGDNDSYVIADAFLFDDYLYVSTALNNIRVTHCSAVHELLFSSPPAYSDSGKIRLRLNLTTTNPTDISYVQVIKNGTLFTTVNCTGSGLFLLYEEENYNAFSMDNTFTFKVSTNQPTMLMGTIDFAIWVMYAIPGTPPFEVPTTINTLDFAPINSVTSLDLNSYAPDIKLIDFIQGLIKTFNLTIIGVNATTFQLETLENWYSAGIIRDITEYTDTASIDVARVKLFKSIDFKHTKSESVINAGFLAQNQKAFGDLSATYIYEGSNYKIETPFEDLLPVKLEPEGLGLTNRTCVSFALNYSLQPYIPKPCILYKARLEPTKFSLNDTIGNSQPVNQYHPFTPDGFYNNNYVSLNWGVELSPLYNYQLMYNGLYSVYYKGYIENLYNKKNRMTSVKAILPISILTALKLNDRLVIRDKRYVINDVKLNLTTGEANLVLLNDFRPVVNNSLGTGGGKPVDHKIKSSLFVPLSNNATSYRLFITDRTIAHYTLNGSRDYIGYESEYVLLESRDVFTSETFNVLFEEYDELENLINNNYYTIQILDERER